MRQRIAFFFGNLHVWWHELSEKQKQIKQQKELRKLVEKVFWLAETKHKLGLIVGPMPSGEAGKRIRRIIEEVHRVEKELQIHSS
jgi:hypothetical protein